MHTVKVLESWRTRELSTCVPSSRLRLASGAELAQLTEVMLTPRAGRQAHQVRAARDDSSQSASDKTSDGVSCDKRERREQAIREEIIAEVRQRHRRALERRNQLHVLGAAQNAARASAACEAELSRRFTPAAVRKALAERDAAVHDGSTNAAVSDSDVALSGTIDDAASHVRSTRLSRQAELTARLKELLPQRAHAPASAPSASPPAHAPAAAEPVMLSSDEMEAHADEAEASESGDNDDDEPEDEIALEGASGVPVPGGEG